MDQILAAAPVPPSGLDVAAFVLAIVSLVATTVWAVASYFLSGSRIYVDLEVRVKVRGTPPPGIDYIARLEREPRFRWQNWGPQNVPPSGGIPYGVVLLRVRVSNVGRMPVNVEKVLVGLPFAYGRAQRWVGKAKRMPRRIEPGSSTHFDVLLSEIEAWTVGLGADRFRAVVYLANRRRMKSGFSYSISARNRLRAKTPWKSTIPPV